MALDLNALTAAVSVATANAAALKTQAEGSSDATNQAAIDSLTSELTAANAVTSALLPPPPPEAPVEG